MLFANLSKIIRNWFLTLQPDVFKTFCNLPKWAQERTFVYALIFALIYPCTWMKQRKASLKFLTNFTSEVINIDFQQDLAF